MQRTFRPTDRGKQLLNADGERVGTITGVSDDVAHVRSDCDADEVNCVTWTDDQECFLIDVDRIERIDPGAARLKSEIN